MTHLLYKKISTLLLLLLLSQVGWAQYAKWKVGVGFQSENMIASPWNDALGPNYSNLSWGWGYNLSTDYLVKDGISVGLRYGYSSFSAKNTSSENQSADKVQLAFSDISIYGDFYILKFFRNDFLPYVQESFFVRVAPVYHGMKVKPGNLTFADSSSIVVQDTTVNINGSSGFGLTLGVGYTKYVTDRISISAIANMDFSGGHSIENLSYINEPSYTTTPSSTSAFVSRFSVEAKVAYTIKQRKPLCPISSCSVQQEHAHAILGGARVRGNTYNYRQNQKYGDVHRGQVEKSKKKKTKSSREQDRIQKKEKRNRKRLRIIGAGH
ncbi:hypothetical protein [Flammeovirga kamogawensis]|uniref:Outer membrane protein beta-barrel domain-containing protein n=1 Tax=Flammeovirga kamogawensis TaxID=373891 RepID=A0ABX8GZA0_9BACT|nr:hypothetical protein [Flammeovirga kamogawensis]MBB6459378.1 hypothetical protein [Flammeovirga kamogawensis]QWG08935.1 hypothetical protein KM029_08320 [Flammeovirga kamogawensis]TRX67226.1 hypothetical protein EO216_03370 [Flammeovirga kamogawensis]